MLTDLEKRALALIDDEELVAWTQALTRINSVWRPELGLGEEEAARWVEARCREIGLETYFEFVQPGRPNVVALLRGAATTGESHPFQSTPRRCAVPPSCSRATPMSSLRAMLRPGPPRPSARPSAMAESTAEGPTT